jgi:malate synthase
LRHSVRNDTASFLDSAIPLQDASHRDVIRYSVETIWRKAECVATLANGRKTKLDDAWQFIGYFGNDPVRFLLFRKNGLHIEIQLDSEQLRIAVDENDTGFVPRNWSRLIRATRATLSSANSRARVRALDRNRTYTTVDGSQISLANC